MLAKRLCAPCVIFLVAVSAFDLVCTLSAHRGGWLLEQNPIARAVLDSHAELGLIIYKVAVTALACVTLWGAVRLGWRKQPRTLLVGMAVCAVACGLITIHWARCLSEFL